jgi:hypothetical protein
MLIKYLKKRGGGGGDKSHLRITFYLLLLTRKYLPPVLFERLIALHIVHVLAY